MENTSLGIKLVNIINELTEIEILDHELSMAIFLKIIETHYTTKMNILENELNAKSILYNVKEENSKEYKNSILSKYKVEADKIIERYETRFVNIALELRNIESNQKIAIANFKNVQDTKKQIIDSVEYVEYISKRKKFEDIIKNTLNSEEFYSAEKNLNELKSPIEQINKKANECIEKYNKYNSLLIECIIEQEIAKKEVIEDLESVFKYVNEELALTKNKSKISDFFRKFLNKLSGASKFKTKVIEKMNKDLEKVSKETEQTCAEISQKVYEFTIAITTMKESKAN